MRAALARPTPGGATAGRDASSDRERARGEWRGGAASPLAKRPLTLLTRLPLHFPDAPAITGPSAKCRTVFSGRGAAWLARLLGVQEVVGSNPAVPTDSQRHTEMRLVWHLLFDRKASSVERTRRS